MRYLFALLCVPIVLYSVVVSDANTLNTEIQLFTQTITFGSNIDLKPLALPYNQLHPINSNQDFTSTSHSILIDGKATLYQIAEKRIVAYLFEEVLSQFKT
ncbi:MAG: hypothetical protein K940chlam8_00778 [Chlamydiae bacterium]|nr:hypothetical protein [Chlamydiota bacterium]